MIRGSVIITIIWALIVIHQISPTHSIHRVGSCQYNYLNNNNHNNDNGNVHILQCDHSHKSTSNAHNYDECLPVHDQLTNGASKDFCITHLSKEDVIMLPIETSEPNCRLHDDKHHLQKGYEVGVDPSSSVIIDVSSSSSGSSDGNDPDNNSVVSSISSTVVIDTSVSDESSSSDADNDCHKYPKALSLKDIWSKYIESPPSAKTMQTLLSKSSKQHHTATNNPLQANGTDKESLYKQFLAQFLDPLASNNRRSIWLDQEFALSLKGTVAIHVHVCMYVVVADISFN